MLDGSWSLIVVASRVTAEGLVFPRAAVRRFADRKFQYIFVVPGLPTFTAHLDRPEGVLVLYDRTESLARTLRLVSVEYAVALLVDPDGSVVYARPRTMTPNLQRQVIEKHLTGSVTHPELSQQLRPTGQLPFSMMSERRSYNLTEDSGLFERLRTGECTLLFAGAYGNTQGLARAFDDFESGALAQSEGSCHAALVSRFFSRDVVLDAIDATAPSFPVLELSDYVPAWEDLYYGGDFGFAPQLVSSERGRILTASDFGGTAR